MSYTTPEIRNLTIRVRDAVLEYHERSVELLAFVEHLETLLEPGDFRYLLIERTKLDIEMFMALASKMDELAELADDVR